MFFRQGISGTRGAPKSSLGSPSPRAPPRFPAIQVRFHGVGRERVTGRTESIRVPHGTSRLLGLWVAERQDATGLARGQLGAGVWERLMETCFTCVLTTS